MMTLRRLVCVTSSLAVLLLGACAPSVKPGVDFQETAVPARSDSYPNWPLPPDEAARVMKQPSDKAVSLKGTEYGSSGAMQANLAVGDTGETLVVKWKEMPKLPRMEDYNNAPRKEIAAYEVQKLFLDPADYVVPTTLASCPGLTGYREFFPEAQPTIPGTNCRLGVFALWLKDVRIPESAEDLYDDARFRSDPVYAYYLSNLNVLMYLIDHRDAKAANFLVAKDDTRRQVFAPDNGISFAPAIYNPFLATWNKIRLPAIRKATVERLREVQRQDLDSLKVLAQLELDDNGIFRVVEPGAPLVADRAVTVTETTIQLGLRDPEIDALYARIQKLVEQADSGEIAVF